MLRKQATKAGRASSGELWGTKMPPLEKSLTSSQCNKGKGPAMGNLGTGRVTMSVHMFRVLYFEPFINLSSWIAEHVMVKAACPRLFEGSWLSPPGGRACAGTTHQAVVVLYGLQCRIIMYIIYHHQQLWVVCATIGPASHNGHFDSAQVSS